MPWSAGEGILKFGCSFTNSVSTSMDEAIEALHLAWEHVERDVALLEHRVAQELAQQGASAIDPLQLVERLRGLRRALPALQADWERLLALKHELIFVTQTILLSNQVEIQQLVADARRQGLFSGDDSNNNEPTSTPLRCFQASCRQWQQALAEAITRNDASSEAFSTYGCDHKRVEQLQGRAWGNAESLVSAASTGAALLPESATGESLDLAMIRAGLPLHTSTSVLTGTSDDHDMEHGDSSHGLTRDDTLSPAGGACAAEDRDQTFSDGRPHNSSPRSPLWSPEGFVPIAKAAFQRLPLLLRRRVASLDVLNQSYAKLFRTLFARERSFLSDDEANALLGPEYRDQLEVLRGLAVLRRSREGWVLAATTCPSRISRQLPADGSQLNDAPRIGRGARPRSSPVPLGSSTNPGAFRSAENARTGSQSRRQTGPSAHAVNTTHPFSKDKMQETKDVQNITVQPGRRSSMRRISRDPLDNVSIM
jgi:hypothetical protein